MKRSPFGIVTIAFMAGITAARSSGAAFAVFFTFSLIFIFLAARSAGNERFFPVFIAISAASLGGAHMAVCENLPHDHISRLAPAGALVSIEGVIDSDPEIRPKFTGFILKAEKLNGRKTSGKILVKSFGQKAVSYGDRLLARGKLYRVPYFRISKRLNYRDHMRNKKIHHILSIGKGCGYKILARGKGSRIKAFIFSIRRRVAGVIDDRMQPFHAGVLSAVLLGSRSGISGDFRENMVRSGTVHIISISGLHVGLVAFIILMLFKMMRVPPRASYLMTIFLIAAYCVLTGARTPVVRVSIMASIALIGRAIARETSIFNTLSLAALLILIFNPLELFGVSFQLSFLSVISIAWLSPRIKDRLERALKKTPAFSLAFVSPALTLFSGSMAAWIGLSPLVAYYFNIVSFIAIPANMIIVPYLALVVGSGLAFILASFLCPPAANILAVCCEASITVMMNIIAIFVKIPGAYLYLP